MDARNLVPIYLQGESPEFIALTGDTEPACWCTSVPGHSLQRLSQSSRPLPLLLL
jgi:hypothetical protein